ncbi:MAG: hypothetical protein JSS66_01275 [Armatimonadetes bacterium]|nr:hypothetical protein [Armatimonadota bacterium]
MRPAVLLGLLCLTLSFAAAPASAQSNMDKEKAKMAKLESSYKTTKAAFTKKPKDASLKKKYVSATVAFATGCMNTPLLPPKEKYKKSLLLYREALKVDPNNKEAKENSKMIEDIYRSMGRPIPK